MKKKTEIVTSSIPVGIVVSPAADRLPRLAALAYVWGPAPESADERGSKAA